MEKEFIPYEEALALKELGFDELCFAKWIERDERDGGGIVLEMWNDEDTYYEVKSFTKAPTFSQAFRWFREKYNAYPIFSSPVEGIIRFHIPNIGNNDYSTYEEAELECLKKLIEIVKNK